MSNIIIAPPRWNAPDGYFLTFDFTAGVTPSEHITLTREKDRAVVSVLFMPDAAPPSKEELDAAFPRPEGEIPCPDPRNN